MDYLILITIGVVSRLLPHLPNFTALGALSLFAGFYFKKAASFIIPFAAMIISDIFIGLYDFKLAVFVYLSIFISVIFGIWLKKRKTWYNVISFSVFSAVSFFLITNFAVWLFTPWYSRTFSGLVLCYFMGLPFLKNHILANVFYAGAFFAAYELVLFRKIKLKYGFEK
jgi:hypothetical protein